MGSAFWRGERTRLIRVAFFVTSFPSLSETFILDQITGLIDRGCEVEIFAELPATAQTHFGPQR